MARVKRGSAIPLERVRGCVRIGTILAILLHSRPSLFAEPVLKRVDPSARYELLLNEYPELEKLRANKSVDCALLHKLATDASSSEEKRIEALVQIAHSCAPGEVNHSALLAIADDPRTDANTAIWAVIAAGKVLGDKKVPISLRTEFYKRLSDPSKPSCAGTVFLLGALGDSPSSLLREWARLLRDPQTSLSVHHAICTQANAASGVYRSVTHDQALNSLLAGYDHVGQGEERRLLLLETLQKIATRAWIEDEADEVTTWYLHSLAQREFCNVKNGVSLRSRAAICIRPDLPISIQAKVAADQVIMHVSSDPKLLRAAQYVTENAKLYGIEKSGLTEPQDTPN